MSKINRFVLPLAGFALLVVLLAVGLKQAPEKGIIISPLVGKPAPGFELPDLLQPGNKVASSQYQGQWYLVNVWGSWCVACRVEHEALLQIKAQSRVPIIGIDWNDADDAGLEWLSKLGNPYTRVASDSEGRTAIAYGVTAKEAEMAGKPFADHASHLVVHGVLHLAGYDHETDRDAEVMEPLEVKILKKLGIGDPYKVNA